MWKNWIRMSRHVIVSDSWWFISKSLASNNFRQISIGLLVKTLGVWAWELSQESQVWAAFFVTCLQLSRIIPLSLPFLNMCVQKKGWTECVFGFMHHIYVYLRKFEFFLRACVCMCGAIWPQASTEKTAEGKPRKAETLVQKKNTKKNICLHSPLATDSDKSVKSHSDHCTTVHSTQLKDAHIYLSSEHLPLLWRNSKIHTATVSAGMRL